MKERNSKPDGLTFRERLERGFVLAVRLIRVRNGKPGEHYEVLHGGDEIHRRSRNTNRIIARGRNRRGSEIPTKKEERKRKQPGRGGW